MRKLIAILVFGAYGWLWHLQDYADRYYPIIGAAVTGLVIVLFGNLLKNTFTGWGARLQGFLIFFIGDVSEEEEKKAIENLGVVFLSLFPLLILVYQYAT